MPQLNYNFSRRDDETRVVFAGNTPSLIKLIARRNTFSTPVNARWVQVEL